MDDNTFNIIYADTLSAIGESRLFDALHSLRGLMCDGSARSLEGECARLADEYEMMLSYVRRGIADPERHTLRHHFLQRAYELLSRAQWHHDKGGKTYFATLARTSPPLPTTDDGRPIDADLVTLFHFCYVEAPWTKADYEQHLTWFAPGSMSNDECLTIVSAITLAAYRNFDPQRLRLLIHLATSDSTTLRVRALTGMVVVCVRYSHLLSLFPDIESALQLLSDDVRYVQDMQALQLQLLLSLRTKEYTKKVEEDILPEMRKMAEKITPHLKKDISALKDLSEVEINPEWDENGHRSEGFKKIEELVEMQKKGADTFYGTFRQISKQTSFFNDIANWFIPFTFDHPHFTHRADVRNSLKAIFRLPGMGNTEKYAISLTLEKVPENMLKAMSENLAQAVGDGDAPDEATGAQDSERDAFVLELRFYVQDLYRYASLFVSRTDNDNPFKLNLTLTDNVHFRGVLNHPQLLRSFADFCFREKSWLEAVTFFEAIAEEERGAEMYEKMGFCQQQLGDADAAIEYYERANLIRPDSAWTLRQMARLYMQQRHYKFALDALLNLEEVNSEDVNTLLRLGECYIALGEPEHAFEKLYKADYLQPDGRALRALAWSSLLTGKYEQANKYYEKILSGDPSAEDCLNAGHAAWAVEQYTEAIAYYQQCLTLRNQDFAPSDFFQADAKVLHDAGKTDEDLLVMRDALNSTLQ